MAGVTNGLTSVDFIPTTSLNNIGVRRRTATNPVIRLPFNSDRLILQTDSNKSVFLSTLEQPASGGSAACDLSLAGQVSSDQTRPLGDMLYHQSKGFKKWRILGLNIKFQTSVTTPTPGTIAVGYTPDPGFAFLDAGTSFTPAVQWQLVSSFRSRVTGPVSARADEMAFTPKDLNRGEMWSQFITTNDSGTRPSGPDQRMTAPGSVFAAGRNLAASTIYGTVELEGLVEFYDPAPYINTGATGSLDDPSVSSGVAPQLYGDTETITYSDTVATQANPFAGTPSYAFSDVDLGVVVVAGNTLRLTKTGVYTIHCTWSSTAGETGTTPYLSALANVGSAQNGNMAQTRATDDLLNYVSSYVSSGGDSVTLDYVGPAGMTSGKPHIVVTYLG